MTSDIARCTLFSLWREIKGYLTKLQVIERKNNTRQFYLVCPAPLAQALELEKGEDIEWVVQDKQTLIVRRAAPGGARRKGGRPRLG